MKKVLTLILAAALAASMTGCAANENESSDNSRGSVSDSKTDSKDSSKTESKEDSKTESKEDSKTESKNDSKTDSKDDAKVDSNVGSSSDEKSEPAAPVQSDPEKTKAEIQKYLNEDLLPLAPLEKEMLESYASVVGANYTDDKTLHTELSTKTLPTAKKLNEGAVELAGKITAPELLEVHNKYLEYVGNLISGFEIMIEALEKQNVVMITNANSKINDANTVIAEYKDEMGALIEKYNISTNTVI